MFYSGYVQSDLFDVPTYNSNSQPVELPSEFSMVDQMDSPHDQGNLGICASVCVSDICKYLFRGQNKSWGYGLKYFYDCRENKSIDGMTPREALQIAEEDGFIRSYALLRNILDIKHSIVANGPVLIGVPVWGSFKDEFWNSDDPSDRVEGYHAVTLVGYTEDSFILRNSWGLTYGISGYVEFPVEDISNVIEAWTVFS